ncbi:YerC/YecD family TrpR-related protein [Macrococcus equipercicus]|uniref:His repressor n=1 Tax=Macrococcus equipercicus TaxID=69967 RepID=A0A9Q9BUQ9_9STAP|nr:YerC/YecD family TrpR-related protein [Macrococcus equipercicus]KAA1037713.1 hypothetical protein ERX35_009140 [Macrococcus equipercicus]UTH13427.1 hypothetical protein KFV11_09355 [Macrococcus equipercicus]
MQIEKLKGKRLDDLFDAVLTLKTREECYEFFDDLCTVNEVHSLSQRLQVAMMIKQGHTYAVIEKESGASTATISRVKRSLQWGNDAYSMVIQRMNDDKQDEQTAHQEE